MTEAEKNEIVGLVMNQISSQAVDFDIETEQPQANDLLTAVRQTSSGAYVGVTIKWDDVARIATELANQAATRAEQAKTNVENMKASVEQTVTDFNALADEKKQEVQGVYQSDLNELKGDLVNQYNYKKIKLFANGYLQHSIKSLVKSLNIMGSFPVTVSAYTNLYGGAMNTVYDIPVQKSGTPFTIFTSDGSNFPNSRIRFMDVNKNELDYFTLSGRNSITVKPTTSSDIYGIMIQANYPTDQKIQIVIGEHKYEYQDYENIQSVTLNSVSDTSVLSTFNNGTYICLSENNTCEIEYSYDVSSDIAIIDDEITNICSTNSVVQKSSKEVFSNIQISETEESSIKLYLYTNLFNCNSESLITYYNKDFITSGGYKISISTDDCSQFEYSKISFLNSQGEEMDYYTLTGYGYKREGLTLNLSDWLWAIKLTAPTQTAQKIQISFGEKALEYVEYIAPQVCAVKVSENIGWESLKIKSDRMYLYTPSQCVISADYYTNKYVTDKDERLKYVSCGDSFTAGDFGNATDTKGVYDYESGYYKTYPWWIAQRNGMNLVNMAHCGDTIRDFMNIYQNIPLDADYVTIAYGLNDYSNNIPIGTLTDTQADNTFLGCWNTALSWILENLPFAHVGVIIMPAYMGNDYREATENVCKKYGIPYLNLYSDNRVPMFMNKIGADENVSSARYSKMVVSSNNGHPNVKAHKFISTSIEGWLKSI